MGILRGGRRCTGELKRPLEKNFTKLYSGIFIVNIKLLT